MAESDPRWEREDGCLHRRQARAARSAGQHPDRKGRGLPWEILATTIGDITGPFYETVEFDIKGTSSKLKVGNKIDVQLKGLTNPVTGEAHEAHMVVNGGFIWTDGNICTTSANKAEADGVRFDHKGEQRLLRGHQLVEREGCTEGCRQVLARTASASLV